MFVSVLADGGRPASFHLSIHRCSCRLSSATRIVWSWFALNFPEQQSKAEVGLLTSTRWHHVVL